MPEGRTKRIIGVRVLHPKHLRDEGIRVSHTKPLCNKRYFEKKDKDGMKYTEVVKELRKGKMAYRKGWEEGELMWQSNGIFVHNTPYWPREQKCILFGAYPYVCEVRDMIANDWVVLEKEKEEIPERKTIIQR